MQEPNWYKSLMKVLFSVSLAAMLLAIVNPNLVQAALLALLGLYAAWGK